MNLSNEEFKLDSAPESSEGNYEDHVIQEEPLITQDKYEDFKTCLGFGLKTYKGLSEADLPEEINKRKKQLAQYEEEGDHMNATAEELAINKLEHLWALSKKIQRFEKDKFQKERGMEANRGISQAYYTGMEQPLQSDLKISSEDELGHLKKEFAQGLADNDLSGFNDLIKEIEQLTKDIEKFEREGKPRTAAEKKNELQNLNKLEEIFVQITKLEVELRTSKEIFQEKLSDEEKLEKLRQKLKEGIEQFELKDASELSGEIAETRKEIEKLGKEGRIRKTAEKKANLEKLEELQALSVRIIKLEAKLRPPKETLQSKSLQSGDIELIEEKLEELQLQLKEGMEQFELNDANELVEEIGNIQEEIERFEKEGRPRKAAEKKTYLQSLESLKLIADQIFHLEERLQKQSPDEEELKSLEDEFNEGLSHFEINHVDDLIKEIKECTNDVIRLEQQGKPRKAAEEKEKLQKLNDLYGIYERITDLKRRTRDPNASKLQTLQKEFLEGLKEHELQNSEDLLKEIEELRSKIKDNEIKRPKKVVELKEFLTELENLLLIFYQISTLKSSNEQSHQKYLRPSEFYKNNNQEGGSMTDQLFNNSPHNIPFDKEEFKEQFLQEESSLSIQLLEKESSQLDESFRTLDTHNNSPLKSKDTSFLSNKNKEEYIVGLSKETSKMPFCSEKCILNLILLVVSRENGEDVIEKENLPLPKYSDNAFQQELQFLKDRLKIEDLESAKVNQLVEVIRVKAKNEEWRAVFIELQTLFKTIKPLNVQELFRLVSKVDEAAESVKDQDIILFLGGTGTGKSTTIHFLAGSKMEETKVEGLTHIGPKDIKNKALRNITTSPFAISETRYIAAVPVNIQEVGGSAFGNVILCDSPGFEDTAGPEVDIANGIGIIRAVRGSRTVKPVILVSSMSQGDRLQGVKNLARILVTMIPGVKEHIKAFSYIFTKFPSNEKVQIHAKLDNLRKVLTPEEQSDKSFIEFFTDMLRKTKREVIAIDPCGDEPGEILDKLVESNAISKPDEVFKFSITDRSKAVIQEQVAKNQLSIMSSVKRSDYTYAKYQLDELKSLGELLELDYITQAYSTCVASTILHLKELYHHSIDTLNKCLKNENGLAPEDIKCYKECIDLVKESEDLRKIHLGKEAIHYSAFVQNIISQMLILFSSLQAMDLSDAYLKSNLDKIKLLCQSFSNIENKYENASTLLKSKFDNLMKSIEGTIDLDDFDRFAEGMTKFHQSVSTLKEHLFVKDMEKKYLNLKDLFLDSIKKSVKEHNLFQQDQLQNKDVESLKSVVTRVETAKSNFSLHSHIPAEQLDEIYEALIEKIMAHFEKVDKEINTKFQSLREKSFQLLEQLVKEMGLIRTIPVIEIRTSKAYYSTLEMLCGFIFELKREVENILAAVFQRKEDANYDKLSSCLTGLQCAKWIGEFRAGIHSDVMDDVKNQILERITSIQAFVNDVCLDLNSPENIPETNKIVIQINKIKALKDIFYEVEPAVEKTNSIFEEKLSDTLVSIKELLGKWNQYISTKVKERGISKKEEEKSNERKNLEETPSPTMRPPQLEYQNLNLKKIDKCLRYLVICSQNKLLHKGYARLFDDMEDFIKGYQGLFQKEMTECFDLITSFDGRSREELFKAAQKLSTYLEETEEIKLKYPQISQRFDPDQKMIPDWKRKLASYLTELSIAMEQMRFSKKHQEHNNMLMITKALSYLDDFLEKPKYMELYRENQNKVYNEAPSNLLKITNAIQAFDYGMVLNEMTQLEGVNDPVLMRQLQEANKILNDHINNMLEETQSMARLLLLRDNVTPEKVEALVKNLKKIQNAKSLLAGFLDHPEKLDECIDKVKIKVSNGLKELIRSIEGLIKSNNFYEIDLQKTCLNMICDILGTYCEEEVVEGSKQLDDAQKTTLDELKTRYSDMRLEEYVMDPPKDLFERFARVKNPKTIYIEAEYTIKQKIIDRFRAEFKKAQERRALFAGNSITRIIGSALNCLPDLVKAPLEAELKNIMEGISKNVQDHNKELNKVTETADPLSIANFLRKCQAQKIDSSVRSIQNLITKQIQEFKSKIITNLTDRDIKEALSNMKKLLAYKEHLGHIQGVKQSVSESHTQISKAFDDIYTSLIKRMERIYTDTVISEDTILATKREFECFTEFLDFKKSNPAHSEALPENMGIKFTALNEKLLKCFAENENKFEQNLQNFNFSGIKNVLEAMKKLNSFFEKVKTYAETYTTEDFSLNELVNGLKKVKSYDKMVETVSCMIKDLVHSIVNIQLINEHTNRFNGPRDEFYKQLNAKIEIVIKAADLETHNIGVSISQTKQECCESLANKLDQLFKETSILLDKFLANETLLSFEFKDLDLKFNNLLSFGQQVKAIQVAGNKNYEKISDQLLTYIYRLESLIKGDSPIESVAQCIIKMKVLSLNMSSFKEMIDRTIDEVVGKYKTIHGAGAIAKLGTILNQDKSGIGANIVLSHSSFQGYALSLFNTKTQKHGIEYVLSNIRGHDLDKDLLKKRYEEFNKIFQALVQQYLNPKIDFAKLIAEIMLVAGDIKQESKNINWGHEIRSRIPNLLAHVFALWTLQNANHYFEAQGLEDKNSYLFQPHAAQVLSIFRMLGIGDAKEELKNNLVQIGTGEGKSVVLSVSAALLALLGFDISCACYSEYLSQRDYKDFTKLFSSLGVEKHIHYGTFNQMCEGAINQYGDIRKVLEKLIAQNINDAIANQQSSNRTRILLIDEVDVFFSKDFYGKHYTPSATLRDPTITRLLDLIWNGRNQRWGITQVKNTNEFRNCCARFKNWESLIEEAVKEAVYELYNYKSHGYEVKEDKIGYKEHDGIAFNVVYGYKTLFAYYHENEQGKISRESLEESKCLRIKCGNFSYAEIPNRFSYIMGVTGTLETLSDPERKVITDDYKIKKDTFTPSVFGKNNLSFRKEVDIKIENTDDYFNRITDEIKSRLMGKTEGTKRAVLAFFESKEKLMDYFNSTSFKLLKDGAYMITEEASIQEKDNIVKRAPTSGQVTLLTRTFGRGTDFVCRDQIVAANGGTHVIQTFLSEELSEEVQIKGRTARQGEVGSYSMILLDTSLETFLITKEDLQNVRHRKPVLTRFLNSMCGKKEYDCEYDFLNEKRQDYFKTQYKDNGKYLEQTQKDHNLATDFLENVWDGKIVKVKKFLLEENQGPQGSTFSRTLCLMDATGSMGHLLRNAKLTVGTMFERTFDILQENGIGSDSFEMQFAVYRNYDCRENAILQNSPWETKADNLRAFMDKINASGGYGHHEAVELGLWHANKENENQDKRLSQVILIGDAPANTNDEVHSKRARLGEGYWQSTKFKQRTFYKDELAKLQQTNVPVHAFYVDRNAEQNFKEIASVTRGRCEMLDINSSRGTEMLTNLVTEEILRDVGKMKGNGDKLVAAYRNKYAKSYA